MSKRSKDGHPNAKLTEEDILETGVGIKFSGEIGGNGLSTHVVYSNINPGRNRFQAKRSRFNL